MPRLWTFGASAAHLLGRVAIDAGLPLLVTYVVVSSLADYRTIDSSQLRANTFLMGTLS